MAEPLKNVLNEEAVRWIADSLAGAWTDFGRAGFVAAAMDGLAALELKQRAAHIAWAMARVLPAHFPDAAVILARSLGQPAEPTGETGIAVLRYMPHDSFIERFGIDHPEAAFALQSEVTRRCSCEFSIRAFLIKYPERALDQMRTWAASDDAHHRRLASEGARPRLPWGQRLPAFVADPAPVIAILERLKDDPVLYVRRSVANNINDIGKDHPETAVALCEAWSRNASDERRWIIGHALRGLVKKGHPGALRLMGGGAPPLLRVENTKLSAQRVVIGSKFTFSAVLRSAAKSRQDLIVDFVIHYVKARGGLAPKVFKLAKVALDAGETKTVSASVSFADMTTRRHHPGRHELALQINGVPFPLADFDVAAK